MAEKRIPLGPTGEAVRQNVRAHRERLNLKFADLSRRLEAMGRPIPVLGLSRIEKGERRVDADDLVCIAAALEVAPVTLLMPDQGSDNPETPVTATPFEGEHSSVRLWKWLCADAPIDFERDDPDKAREMFRFLGNALPHWRIAEMTQTIADVVVLEHGSESQRQEIMRRYDRGND